jgi:ubiquinol-cytochrome c reductase iron-sulfur subunit
MSAPTTPGTDAGRRPGSELVPAAKPGELDVSDPRLSRFEVVREGARRNGVEIVHYQPRFPPGSRAERRVERVVAAQFLLSGAAAIAFTVAYIWWPWEAADAGSSLYTPVLGVTMGLALLGLGTGLVTWVKKRMPHELAIEERHDGGSGRPDQLIMGATMNHALEETGLTRRPLLKGAVALGLAPLGILAAAPLIGGLIKDPLTNRTGIPGFETSPDRYTGWHPAFNGGRPVRLVHEDGTPIRPADVSVGGQITAFPGIPGGATNRFADSPTLLIHLRDEHATELRANLYSVNQDSMDGNFVAYSKICTHAGCPPSLFEQQTNLLLCPCHQSQFLITDNARPVFGPAARSLPMLPIGLDAEGFFVAREDFKVPVGPSFWER